MTSLIIRVGFHTNPPVRFDSDVPEGSTGFHESRHQSGVDRGVGTKSYEVTISGGGEEADP